MDRCFSCERKVAQRAMKMNEYAVHWPLRHRILAILGMIIMLAGIVCQNVSAQTSEWVWMGGSQTAGAAGVYGTKGIPAAGNVPGARQNAFTWVDTAGNLWIFGGSGKDSAGTQGELNDLWEYNTATGQWAWISGSNTVNAAASYGTQGTASTGNTPGSRDSGVAWADSDGNLWLFGGNGNDSAGTEGLLNDLWKFDTTALEWKWVGGSKSANASGVYGTQNTADAANIPGAREGEDSGGVLAGWADNDGNFWLFGGKGYDSAGSLDSLNDLWEYSPTSQKWTWISGSKTINGIGIYGMQGVAGSGYTPSARQSTQTWKDKDGKLWLHGGSAYNDVVCTNKSYECDDSPEIWKFDPVSKEWAWISGQDSSNTGPVYSTQGVSSDTSDPGGREMSATWTDTLGTLWLFSGYAMDGQRNNAPDDLWMYNTSSSQWTWVGGSSNTSISAVYGSLGTPAAANWPDARGIEGAAATWTDLQGNFWLFGGPNGSGLMNALWVYHASPAATPAFSVSGSTYSMAQTVNISDATPGAMIHYTTDGSTPGANSTMYSGALTVSASETLNAIAIAAGYPNSAIASAAYTIAPITASPSFTPAAGTYTSAQTVTIAATSGATIYYTTDGTTPTTSSAVYSSPITVSSTETIQALAVVSGASASSVASATYTINIASNPVPVVGSLSPAFTTAGSGTFTLTVNGSSFSSGSTVYWGSMALTTKYVSATQLTAQVPASLTATAGTPTITVQTPTPGGGTSNSESFEIDSAGSGVTPPSFTTPTATVAAGVAASYQVTLPSSAMNVSVSCLNLPSGASCSYSASSKSLTITTSSTTPKGTYQIIAVFQESVSIGTSAAYLTPFFLLPLVLLRKNLRLRNILSLACMVLLTVAMVFSTGCGGSSSGKASTNPTSTQTVTSSGTISLTVQ